MTSTGEGDRVEAARSALVEAAWHIATDEDGWTEALDALIEAVRAEGGGEAALSDTSSGGRRLSWREVAEREREHNRTLQGCAALLSDLSRCEHGRHLGDVCSSCGGPSVGNLILTPGMVIGHDISGRPITVPAKAQFASVEEWRALASAQGGATDA